MTQRELFEVWAQNEPYHKFDFTLFAHGNVANTRTYLDIVTEVAFKAYIAGKNSDQDGMRYRAITARHSMALVSRFLNEKGYSSAWAKTKLDAWADSAVMEVSAWDSMSAEEKQQNLEKELKDVILKVDS
jgi:hypothetical protein